MRLHIFQSDKGDCLLLESADGKHRILCDGGMSGAMREHVRPHLSKLRDAGQEIDAVYVSHVDQDHILGVLQLLQDELAWRVFDHHGGTTRKPKVPRPPVMHRIWHNAFRDQVPKNHGDIEKLLAAAAPVLFGTGLPDHIAVAHELNAIANGVSEALKVSKLASPDLLDIPVNEIPGVAGKQRLMMVRAGQPAFSIGSLRLTIVGPTRDELENLREGWNNWLRENGKVVRQIREQMEKRMDEFASGEAENPFDLRDWFGVPDHEGVTAPNVASLMFMVEENGKRLLLTGDSQQDIILKGLTRTGFLESGSLHLDVLKVQHHGSENNVDDLFCRQVSADHYVFCGNGSHGNPEPEVLQTFFDSRLGPAHKRAQAPEAAGRPFHFWFSAASSTIDDEEARENFEQVQHLVQRLEKDAQGQLVSHFNTGDVHVLDV
jgi:beta-lactamase superfamily II metal-dependent hydrolase